MKQFLVIVIAICLCLVPKLALAQSDPIEAAHSAAKTLYEQERYDEALSAFETALALARRSLGISDDLSLDIVDDIANVLWNLERKPEIMALRLRVVAEIEALGGREHADLVRPLSDLAWAYPDEAWQTKADPVFRRALGIAETTFEPNSLKFADVLYDYANFNFFNDHNKDADPYYRRALAIYDQVPEIETEKQIDVHNRFAWMLEDDDREEEALKHRFIVLELRKRSLDPDHSDFSYSYTAIGNGLRRLGRYAEAEPYSMRALEIDQRVKGTEYKGVAEDHVDLAMVYDGLKRYGDATKHYRQALAIREKLFGGEDKIVSETL